jgi:ADP-ribose pyrophosphatase YjhB (NUDIX family)
MVLCTRAPEGPAVVLSKRNSESSYGNTWWMYGGALPAYAPIADFITKRAEEESGIAAAPQILVGIYRICAADRLDSSLTLCFAAEVPYEEVTKKMSTDKGHQEVRLFTLKELDALPQEETHWYPTRVAQLALEALQNARS